MNEQTKGNEKQKKPRKPYVRSPFLFPAYDFGVAQRIAEIVERDGAGSLSEETLAIALRLSPKSSGFQLRTLAARQFKLLTKQGEILSTTLGAKAILKPTTDEEKRKAVVESFLEIPLFKAVVTKFKGQPLPQSEVFRNVLEREFRIEGSRVADAERVLMDSAREASLLQQAGDKTYITTEILPTVKPPVPVGTRQDFTPPVENLPISPSGAPQLSGGLLTVSEEDLAEFDDKEFNEIWQALGKIVRVRGKRQKENKNE